MSDPFNDSGPVFKVVPAVRKAIPALIALWGFSDSGKTFSALRLARGLVGPQGKIVVIDTENGRALIYADQFTFDHIDLQPPFTPERYSAAYDAAREAGAQAIIVDSGSHVWEGDGGVLDMADRSPSKGIQKWKAPKTAYKRMNNALWRSPVHMIFCLRAKEKFLQIKDDKGKDTIVSAGHVAITDSRFVYEMTVAVHMESGTRKPLSPVKMPAGMPAAIIPGEFITEEAGEKIAAYLAGGKAIDKAAEAIQAKGRDIATEGSVALKAWWSALTKADKARVQPIGAELRSIADQADADGEATVERATAASDGESPLDDGYTRDAA